LGVIAVRYLRACALAALILATGCAGSGIKGKLGVKVYPGAKLKATGTSAKLNTASFEVTAPLDQVDAFYVKEMGPSAVRTVHTSSRGDRGIRFIWDKSPGEQIVVVIVQRQQSAVTDLLMSHQTGRQ
jgi:hypothetical protein